MPTFNMAAQTPNGQPGGTETVYTNGLPQTYPGRKLCIQFFLFVAFPFLNILCFICKSCYKNQANLCVIVVCFFARSTLHPHLSILHVDIFVLNFAIYMLFL